MKHLLFFLSFIGIGCHNTETKTRPKTTVHYPRVVYNICADEYAILTDSTYGRPLFFGKEVPLHGGGSITFVGGGFVTGAFYDIDRTGIDRSIKEPPPTLIDINSLHDTLKYAELGGEFQFKDSLAAIKAYSKFIKQCKDTEDIINVPIRKKIREYNIADSIQRIADSIQKIKDSVAKTKQHAEDSVFKCQHTYN